MGIIERNTKIGKLFVSDKTYKVALEKEGKIISDAKTVWGLLDTNRVPVKGQFEITQKCNFDCYYCYEKSLRNRKDLTTEEVKQILDKFEEIGVVFLELTGGEPLARKDILELLRYMNSKKFIISMITNGSNLTEEIAEELGKGNIQFVRLSLLAANEEVCDRLTKVKGSYQKTLRGARILKKYNINFTLTSVITNQNIDQYEEYKKLEEDLSIKIGYGINVGAAFTGYDEVKEYELKKNHLDKLKSYIDVNGTMDTEQEFVCSGGKSKFAIDNQGNVLPCVKCRSTVGNLLTQSFEEIWQSERLKHVISCDLVRPEKCKNCEKRNYCEAYCPAEYKYYDTDEERCSTANLIAELIRAKGGN